MDIGALSLDDIILLIVGVLVAILILRLIFGSIGKIIGLVINSVFGAILLMSLFWHNYRNKLINCFNSRYFRNTWSSFNDIIPSFC